MDEHDPVIYVGTFSKTLFPVLRLGYLIVPARLVDTFARARAVIDRHPSALEQAVLADFIVEGHFARHVWRVRALYAKRKDMLLDLVAQRLGEWIQATCRRPAIGGPTRGARPAVCQAPPPPLSCHG